MFKEYLNQYTGLNVINYCETINQFDLVIHSLTDDWMIVSNFCKTLVNIPTRDKFELQLVVSGNTKSIIKVTEKEISELKVHFDETIEANGFELNLKINKTQLDSKISIYSFEKFTDYLTRLNFKSTFSLFSLYIKDGINFDVFDAITPFGSDRINFYPHDNFPEKFTKCKIDVKTILTAFTENSVIHGHMFQIIPNDFQLNNEPDSALLKEYFADACVALSMLYLASNSELVGNNFIYRLNGYKTIKGTTENIQHLKNKSEFIYKIYSWAYEDGKSIDKLGLVRNVLSLHTDNSGAIEFSESIWSAIQSNYQIYLQNNIQSYLDVKNKITEFVIEAASKTYSFSDLFLESFKNNIFVLLTFLITVVLINGLKESGIKDIFSLVYVVVVLILSTISIIWLCMTKSDTKSKFENATEIITEILKRNYGNVLISSEIDQCIEPIFKKNKEYLEKQVKKYSDWWKLILLVFTVMFISASVFFHHVAVSKNTKTTKNTIVITPKAQLPILQTKNDLNDSVSKQKVLKLAMVKKWYELKK